MTGREDTPTQLYVPALRRTEALRALPRTVRFLDPGLPQTAAIPELFHPATYPFPREQAARVLDELLAVGEALDLAGPTGGQSARAVVRGADEDEKAALVRFSVSGSAEPAGGDDPKVAAQKVLLLAWDLETRLLEIESLRREIAAAVAPLRENLHGGDPDGPAVRELARAVPGALPEDMAGLADLPEPDWRMTLAAMAAFIPDGALLVTGHAGMRDAMLDAGMLHPLPEDVSHQLAGWPETLQSRLLWAKTPLWRVLGHSRAPENAPWLLAAPEIIVCPA